MKMNGKKQIRKTFIVLEEANLRYQDQTLFETEFGLSQMKRLSNLQDLLNEFVPNLVLASTISTAAAFSTSKMRRYSSEQLAARQYSRLFYKCLD